MSNSIPVKFCFKGSRDYVQGGDIFNEVIQIIKSRGECQSNLNVDLIMRNVLRTNADLFFVKKTDNNSDKLVNATINISCNTNQYQMILVENDTPIDQRNDYFEEEIIKSVLFNEDEKAISLEKSNHYTVIERIIALNKVLLNKLFPNHGGKWYFVKIKLRDWDINMEDSASIKLSFKKNLDFKLTDTLIYVEGEQVGNIYFSLI
jgi:hypothetical protein